MNFSKLLSKSVISKSIEYFGRRNKPSSCKKRSLKVTHCIFDLDGIILDNHEVLHKGLQSVFEEYKLNYNKEWHEKMMGMTGKAMWHKVMSELKLQVDWQTLNDSYMRKIQYNIKNRPIKPGVEKLLNHLHDCGIPMGMVTSMDHKTMADSTSHIRELLKKFEVIVCGGDDPQINKSKPSYQIYIVTAKRFNGKPDGDTCLVFEDSPNGITAAKKACMQVVGIPCMPMTAWQLRNADEVINDLNDFTPVKYGIPPFKDESEK